MNSNITIVNTITTFTTTTINTSSTANTTIVPASTILILQLLPLLLYCQIAVIYLSLIFVV